MDRAIRKITNYATPHLNGTVLGSIPRCSAVKIPANTPTSLVPARDARRRVHQGDIGPPDFQLPVKEGAARIDAAIFPLQKLERPARCQAVAVTAEQGFTFGERAGGHRETDFVTLNFRRFYEGDRQFRFRTGRCRIDPQILRTFDKRRF
jgi:hypothetical protein